MSVVLLIVLGTMLRTFTTTPLYRAQARLMIELEDEQAAALAGVLSGPNSYRWQDPQVYYETQYRILTGRELAMRVVRRLDLGSVPEFSAIDPTPTRLNRMISTLTERVMGPSTRLDGSAPSRTDVEASAVAESLLVSQLLARVSVEPVPNSRLVDVAFVSADPAFAVRAVDALAKEYVQQNLELRRQTTVMSLEWLSQELVKQQKKLEDSQRAMARYREAQNALSLEEHQNIVVGRLNQLNDAVTRAKLNLVQKEALNNQINALGADVSADTIPALLQNAYIQTIKTRLAELQREKATLLERYGEKYPDVMKVNVSLQDASRQLQTELAKAIEAIRNDYQSALAEERTLAAALEEQKAAAMDLNRKSVGYTVLEREADSNRKVFETLLQREKELQVMANSRGNNVRMTDHAEKPAAPFTPRPRRDLLLAIVAGLALSLGLVFLLDYLDDTVKTPDDLTDKLKIPLLGLAPKVTGGGELMLSQKVPHEFGEAFRSLRTSLNFSSGPEPTRCVMVTSAQPLDGKTTTACNLALAIAIGGARVLLIDADMRRSGVHRMLKIENGTGLSHVLTGQAPMGDALVALETPKMWAMTAGVSPPNPSELLGSDQMRTLLDEAKNGRFDWVIIDSPPVLPVTDAVVLSPLVSGIVFVVGSEMTRRPQAARALEILTASGCRLLGAVLNRVDLKRNRYYYSRYYGYKNRNYYFTSPAA
jgi:capsular exopolysaccharide synthesis family protein